jgi:hypothetical protein
MNPHPVHRLPAPLESAVQRIKLTARAAAERAVESLGLAALASSNILQRDAMLGAQFELNRKSAIFALAFNEAFDQRLLRELAPRSGETPARTSWDALSLVEDHELELDISAERFALEIAHGCESELRELGSYIVPLLGRRIEQDKNPLRPQVVGHAMMRSIEAVSDRADVRKALTSELGRALGGLLPSTYGKIIADLRQSGVQPVALQVTVRTAEARGAAAGAASSDDTRGRPADIDSPDTHHGGPSSAGGFDSRHGSRRGASGGASGGGPPSGPSTRSGGAHGSMDRGTMLGQVDPVLMSVIRRLAYSGIGGGAVDSGSNDWGDAGGGAGDGPLPNLIQAHREELRQAANGSLDHMVIDVIGSLFEQILSDAKVPPQMARQIARLQLPVLRAALGDPTFFSSRRHPVRRFVNRIASLGAAFEDFNEAGAQRVLAKVRALVQDVVEGDFEQIEVYEQQLVALEAFVAEQGKDEAQAQGGAADLLSAKEDEQRLRQLYAQQLQGELKGLSAPDFVRDFITQVWSQVLLRTAAQDGPDSARVRRLRHVGRELFMSVQPKVSPQQRKAFLAELPKLMKELGEGMALIGWPEAQRRNFFGQLLPAHAESLKAQQQRPLDFNLLARQVDGALEKPLPSRADLRLAPAALPVPPVLADEIAAPQFSAEEAQRIGLVDEAAVDWTGKVAIDQAAEPEISAADVQIAGLPAAAQTPEPLPPTAGRSLAEHVQIGFAYQMHIADSWLKVRLVHVSPGRSFFVFNHGKRHKETISLTQRMLVRLCEAGRMRAFEQAELLERATARARQQLAGANGASASAN